MSAARVLIVSPLRNEAEHIERTARSVAAQTRPPDLWLVVDDGSEDDTLAILRRLERELPFLRVLVTPVGYTTDHGDRHAVAAAPRAFNWALATEDPSAFTHVGKLDGDIELPPNYFERLLAEFERDHTLGLAGGTLVERTGGEWRAERVAKHHVRGALKLYTRPCFEAIGGVQERLGWDGIDETYARMHGFRTRSFGDVVARHHRPCGSADGRLKGRLRGGETHYVLGFHLLWVVLKSFKVAASRPRVISGAAFLFGYIQAAARSTPRVDDEAYQRFLRRDLRRRLLWAVGAPLRRLRLRLAPTADGRRPARAKSSDFGRSFM